MIIMIILLTLFIINIILCLSSKINDKLSFYEEEFKTAAFLGGIAITAFSIVICLTQTTAGSDYAEYNNKYNTLIELSKIEENKNIPFIVQEIVNYNAEAASYNIKRNNPWINWFVPQFAEDLPLIELNEVIVDLN